MVRIFNNYFVYNVMCCALVKPYVYADTLDVRQLDTTVVNYDIDRVVHFSALLSAVAEQNVARGLQVPHSLALSDSFNFSSSGLGVGAIRLK